MASSRYAVKTGPRPDSDPGTQADPGLARALVEHAVRHGELFNNRPQLVYNDARRFPAPRNNAPRDVAYSALPTSDQLALVDRVDVLLAVVHATPFSRAKALVATDSLLLGHVRRDDALLFDLLLAAQTEDEAFRERLVVALGPLGAPVPVALAVPCPDSETAVAALMLHAGLLAAFEDGGPSPEFALECAMEARESTPGDARRAATRAHARLTAGR